MLFTKLVGGIRREMDFHRKSDSKIILFYFIEREEFKQMKKFLTILFVLMLTVLAACGDSSDSESDESGEQVSGNAENETENEDDGEAVESEENKEGETKTSEENESTEAAVGDVITNEAGASTLVSRTDDIGTFESGPIQLTIEKANGVSMEVSDDFVDYFTTEQLEYIQVDLQVENTSEDDVTFFASQAVMTTSTGEQLEPDMLMSEHIDGEFFGKVKKSGTSIYVLENSKAEDIESIRLIFTPAYDDNFETIGDDIDVEIELNK